jgi:hypothetical protein
MPNGNAGYNSAISQGQFAGIRCRVQQGYHDGHYGFKVKGNVYKKAFPSGKALATIKSSEYRVFRSRTVHRSMPFRLANDCAAGRFREDTTLGLMKLPVSAS